MNGFVPAWGGVFWDRAVTLRRANVCAPEHPPAGVVVADAVLHPDSKASRSAPRCCRCDLELVVPYALFENDQQLTRPFRTEREVWEAAERADLIVFGSHGEKTLDNDFEIKPCEAAPEEMAAAEQEIVFPERRPETDQPESGTADPASPPVQVKSKATSSSR
jgi:hypothetical protein